MTATGNNYLQDLTLRLALGAASLDSGIRDRHATWLQAQQRDDGGFAGREGESDPYYTAFALRALMILGALSEPIGQRAADFLKSRLTEKESIIDLISLVFGAAICELSVGAVVIDDDDDHWRDNIGTLMNGLRTEDGGFAKTLQGRAGSTYQTFLTTLCYQLMDHPVPDGQRVVDFINSQARADGGYLEIRVQKRPGVNPTAAAIGTLKAMGALEPEQQQNTVEFLQEMQTDEGGLTANTRIPFADLLSSCTGLITLFDLQAIDRVNVSAIEQYAASMQAADGGFVGFALDQTADVEYTFYGLATLALCQLA